MHQPVTPTNETSKVDGLKKELNSAISKYRAAVKWLRDARTYKMTFSAESWKESESEISKDSERAYKEAINSVLYWRKKKDGLQNKIMDLTRRKNGRKSK